MTKQFKLLNLLLITFFWACQEPELKIPIEMPDTKPPLFGVQTGLPPELKEKKIIFEKYIQWRSWDSRISRLYINRDFYEIHKDGHKSFEEDSVSWKKMGVFTPYYINKLQKISNTHVVQYLNDGPHKLVAMAASNSDWYFYFDEPKFVQTQGHMFTWPWETPKFVRKIDAILERNRNYENLVK